MEKVYCKNCEHLFQDIKFKKCTEVLQNTYYTREYGNPIKINANNDCNHFKLKKKKKRRVWHYWFAAPWI